MTKRFLGLGECMVELSGVPGQSDHFRMGYAGDVFNTLWYARALLPEAWEVGFQTAVGTDQMSDQMLTFIQEAGVDTSGITRIEDRVPGLYAIQLDGAERSFSYWRDSSAARQMMADRDGMRAKIMASDLLYFSGITIAILPDEDAEALIEMLTQARDTGKTVVFDPNIRPRLWANIDRLPDVTQRAAAASSIVLPSFDDEQTIFGDADVDACAARYHGLGVKTVIVKDGENPTVLSVDGVATYHDVAEVSGVVDTTAAGDSFNGGFLASYLMDGDGAKAIKAGQDCAAYVICHHGALVKL